LSIVIGIEVSPFALIGKRSLEVPDVRMEKTSLVMFSSLVRVNVQGRRLHQSKQQSSVRQDGRERTHQPLILSQLAENRCMGAGQPFRQLLAECIFLLLT